MTKRSIQLILTRLTVGCQSKFKGMELKSLKFAWMPRGIIFSDGTSVGTDGK